MKDLVPQDFVGVIKYCATDDLIYVNGQTTCVDPNDPDYVALVQNAFKDDWFLAHGTCPNMKNYEIATDDQLFITNHMLNGVEGEVKQLEKAMDAEELEKEKVLNDYKIR